MARPFATAGAKELKESSSRGKVSSLPIFDASVILAATNNFAPSNKLGEGGFGTVYKVIFQSCCFFQQVISLVNGSFITFDAYTSVYLNVIVYGSK